MKNHSPALPAATILVAVHNEAQRLSALLAALQEQNYPAGKLKVMIIDDRSTDATPQFLRQFQANPHFEAIRIENVSPRYSPKKFAIAAGVGRADSELIVLTDADCRPGRAWARTVAQKFHENCVAAVGFSPVFSRNRRLSQLLQCDSVAVATHCLAGIGWKKPFMATGRNFAYRRSAFEAVGGFSDLSDELSGDDDLLVQRLHAANLGEVEFIHDPAAHVPSEGPATFFEWLIQKRRHLSAGKRFPFKIQLGYFVFHGSNLILWLAPILSGLPGFVALAAKLGSDFLILRLTCRRLHFQINWLAWPLWELAHVAIHTLVGPWAFMGRVRWKSDKLKAKRRIQGKTMMGKIIIPKIFTTRTSRNPRGQK